MVLSPSQIRYIVQAAALLLMCLHLTILRIFHRGPGITLWVSLAIVMVFLISFALRMIVYLSFRKTPYKNADVAQTTWDSLNYYGFAFFAFAIHFFIFFSFNVLTIILFLAAMVFIFPVTLLLDGLIDRRGAASVSDIQAAIVYCQAAYKGVVSGNVITSTKYVVLQEFNALQVHVNQNLLVITFAGSPLKETDIETGMDMLSASYGPDLVTDTDALALVGQGLGAHKGFFDAYMSVRTALQQIVKQTMTDSVDTILVTGYSLGGAMASLCAFDLACNSSYLGFKNRAALSMITFGAPALASTGMQTAFDTLVPNSTRVYHVNDPVVYINSWQFQHVGHAFMCTSATFSILSQFSGSYSQAVAAEATMRKRYIIAASVSGPTILVCCLGAVGYRWWALKKGRSDYLDVNTWRRRPEITKRSLSVYDR